MNNFWDSDVWGFIILLAVLLISLLVANAIKRKIPFLKKSLIPTSVLGGIILLTISMTYSGVTGGKIFFDGSAFGGYGSQALEVITYHCLALGFIATSFKPRTEAFSRKRNIEIFNTGVTTVSTYLLQGICGLGITIIASYIMKDFFAAAGLLLPFGYGQGTGQAMNYGTIYQIDYGFDGGKSFGLTIAAMGFLSASIGGVIHLNILKRKKKIKFSEDEGCENELKGFDVQGSDEIPMNGSMDKLSVQLAFVFTSYAISYLIMYVLGNLIPGLRSVIYGFNFLFGVLVTIAVCAVIRVLRQKKIMHRQYINVFLMKRVGGFFFDLMVVAGIAAIRLDVLARYWIIILILGIVGLLVTYFYNRFIAKKFFPEYKEEQFLAMYGMLTGTASTGVILLREIDRELESPAADNMVYQNLPAMIFGFPLMILATLAPKQPVLTLILLAGFFVFMNVVLFRRAIFCRRRDRLKAEAEKKKNE